MSTHSLRAAVRRALGLVGLASARQVRALQAKVASAKRQGAEVKGGLAEAKRNAARWKQKGDESTRRLDKAQREAERFKARHAESSTLVASLQGRLERLKASARATALAREHLMAIDTKLDIVEGAINVLDRRTRRPAATRGNDSRTDPTEQAETKKA